MPGVASGHSQDLEDLDQEDMEASRPSCLLLVTVAARLVALLRLGSLVMWGEDGQPLSPVLTFLI